MQIGFTWAKGDTGAMDVCIQSVCCCFSCSSSRNELCKFAQGRGLHVVNLPNCLKT